MGLVDDFVILPDWIKLMAFLAILLGTTFTLPFFNLSLGDVLNPFFGGILGAFGFVASFKEIVIVIFLSVMVAFVLAFSK